MDCRVKTLSSALPGGREIQVSILDLMDCRVKTVFYPGTTAPIIGFNP